MSEVEAKALRWYAARNRQRETLAALREYRQRYGGCVNGDRVRVYSDDPTAGPCYVLLDPSSEEWCQVCRGSQPLYLARKAAAIAAGVALRALVRACALVGRGSMAPPQREGEREQNL